MLTFSDLVKNGVASFKYRNLHKETTETDPIVRMYNCIWGIVNDTHMSKSENGEYIITGSAIRNTNMFMSFLSCSVWGGYHFPDISGSAAGTMTSFNCAMGRHGYYGGFQAVNGDTVFVYRKSDDECGCCPCCNGGDVCVKCCESIAREPIASITDDEDVLETIFDGKASIIEAASKLGENKHIRGSIWNGYVTEAGVTFLNEDGQMITIKKS